MKKISKTKFQYIGLGILFIIGIELKAFMNYESENMNLFDSHLYALGSIFLTLFIATIIGLGFYYIMDKVTFDDTKTINKNKEI